MERESEVPSIICIACDAAAIVNSDFERLAALLTTPTCLIEKMMLRPMWIFDATNDSDRYTTNFEGLRDLEFISEASGAKEWQTLGSGKFH